MTRYKLPQGVSCISVCGQMFNAGEPGGVIQVPLGTPGEVLAALVDLNHGAAVLLLPEDPQSPASVSGDAEALTDIPESATDRNALEKRMLRDMLKLRGVSVPGRATIEYLREKLAEALAPAAPEQPAPTGSDQPTTETLVAQAA